MNVAVFGTRNEDNLNRIYRLCAFFGVETLAVVGSRARVRGNLFSAAGRVSVEYLEGEDEFWGRGYTPIIAGVVTGGDTPHPLSCLTDCGVICVGSENAPVPRSVRERAHYKWTIPRLGTAPPLTADQALAILLYAACAPSRQLEESRDYA